jgi:hypothetical protein
MTDSCSILASRRNGNGVNVARCKNGAYHTGRQNGNRTDNNMITHTATYKTREHGTATGNGTETDHLWTWNVYNRTVAEATYHCPRTRNTNQWWRATDPCTLGTDQAPEIHALTVGALNTGKETQRVPNSHRACEHSNITRTMLDNVRRKLGMRRLPMTYRTKNS